MANGLNFGYFSLFSVTFKRKTFSIFSPNCYIFCYFTANGLPHWDPLSKTLIPHHRGLWFTQGVIHLYNFSQK